MAEIIDLELHRPEKKNEPQKAPSKLIKTHTIDEEGNLEFFDEETWFTVDMAIQEGNAGRARETETAGLQAQFVDQQARFDEEILRSAVGTQADFDRVLGVPMAEIIDLVEIHKEKERQKELQEEYEVEHLRAQLRWVLDKIHQKNITYQNEEQEEEEQEEDPTTLSGAWFRKLFRRKQVDIDL